MKLAMQPTKQAEKVPRDFALQTLTIPANLKWSTCTPNKQQGNASIIKSTLTQTLKSRIFSYENLLDVILCLPIVCKWDNHNSCVEFSPSEIYLFDFEA